MTTPKDVQSHLTDKQRRLVQEQACLQAEWALRQEKLEFLRQALAIEANVAQQFQLQQQIEAESAQLAELEAKLTALEQELAIARVPCNVPHRGTQHFVGRDEDLERLHEQLQTGATVAISAIAGMGGIGKTELAVQYALQQRDVGTYPGGICWLRAREDGGVQIVALLNAGMNRRSRLWDQRAFAKRPYEKTYP